MPTYVYECKHCGDHFDLWQSIHAESLTVHDSPLCGGRVVRVMQPVRTHGIGSHGAHTLEVDAREGRWTKDMDAYKRFRGKGHQPRFIDGCDKLEATAISDWQVKTGQAHPDEKVHEGQEIARAIMRGQL